jgi:protein ImuA
VTTDAQKEIISKLQKDILQQEGYKHQPADIKGIAGLGAIEAAFPGGVFPAGAIHEFLAFEPEHGAASSGFIAGLLNTLMQKESACVWVSAVRKLFPPALKAFGVVPDRIIFVNVPREKDVLWVMEEALKCKGLAAVIAEVRELTFMQSRRLQLVVETSCVTGFILRNDARRMNPTACTARWQIKPVPSQLEDGMPGVGFPRWQVELLRVRNGKPGRWTVEWQSGQFNLVTEKTIMVTIPEQIKIAG